MDRIKKALLKLPDNERRKLLTAFAKIVAGHGDVLDVKKLKGHASLYRLRVGNNRLVYEVLPDNTFVVRFVGRRDGQTYRDF